MTAQNHGNTSAAEPNQTPRRDVSTYLLPASLAVFGLVALSAIVCWGVYEYFPYPFSPRVDEKGNRPDDTIRNFLEFVEAENNEAARQQWCGPLEKNELPRPFEAFCTRYKKIGLKNFKLSWANKSKSGDWTVRVDFEEGGEQKHHFFYFMLDDGEWRIKRDQHW